MSNYPQQAPPQYDQQYGQQQKYPQQQQGYPPQQGYPQQQGYPPQQPMYQPQGGPPAIIVQNVTQQQPGGGGTIIVTHRPGVNHCLHFCISLFFFPWIIVWIFLCVTQG